MKEAVEKKIGGTVKVEEVRKIKENTEKGTECVWMKLEKEEEKRTIWEGKRNLKDRKERIVENLT